MDKPLGNTPQEDLKGGEEEDAPDANSQQTQDTETVLSTENDEDSDSELPASQGLVESSVTRGAPIEEQNYDDSNVLPLPDPQGPVESSVSWGAPIPQQREVTRGRIAAALLGILGFLVVGSFISLWFGWATSADLDALLTLLFAPVIGLVGAATGFYFGERAAEDDSES